MEEKRPKPGGSRAALKDEVVRMRIPSEQKAAIIKAAEADGLDLSTWLRRLALREVGLLPKAKGR